MRKRKELRGSDERRELGESKRGEHGTTKIKEESVEEEVDDDGLIHGARNGCRRDSLLK